MSGTAFGHRSSVGGGTFIDSWGSGPFLIEVDGKVYRFEDSEMFGPAFIDKRGEITKRQPGAHHRFWRAHTAWIRQGRRVAEDGVTCRWSLLKPTIWRQVGGRHYFVTEVGDEGGENIYLPPPACGEP